MSKATYYISAYSIAVKHGFTGTEEEWVKSLQGRDGKDGAVTWEELTPEQRAELVGPRGPEGPEGPKGSDAEVTKENVVQALRYTPVSQEQMKKAAPNNLLDNSDFRNPVNLHGKTHYAAAGYTINRWFSKNSYPVELTQDGISITESIHQYVRADADTEYTVAAMDDAGDVHMICEVPRENVYHEDMSLDYSAEKGVSVRLSGRTYRWAAMYKGRYTEDSLPVYRPKGYGAELSSCKQTGDDGKGTGETMDFLEVAVAGSDFQADETYPDYPNKADIALNGVTEKMAPEVVFPVTDIGYAPVCESYDGGVTIYTDSVPENGIVLPRITVRRVNGT